MRRTMWCMAISVCLFLFEIVGLGEAAELVSPPEGAIYEVGKSYVIRVEPGPGETLISMLVGLTEVKPAPGSRILEYTGELPKDVEPGPGEESVAVFLIDRNGQHQEIDLSHTITVILPPTTTVTGIGAGFPSDKETFLEIARKPSGELVVTEGTSSTDRISVSAFYSDGVMRDITDYSKLKYISANDKVAIVIPRVGARALVKATGPGTTDIIVQYGNFTDRVTVKVKECPYIEGVTDKRGCPMR